MKIGLIGAFDRNNYGDILMPIVMTNQIKKNITNRNFEFVYYGLSDSNMEYTGGYNTQKFSNIYKENCDVVIYVGGEILTSRYIGMYLNLQTSKLKIFLYKCARKVLNEITENRCRKILGCKSLKPWITNKNVLNCKALIYNTVGGDLYFGTTDKNKREVENDIKLADYISIREKETLKVIKEINEDARLYPDSVISISKLLSEEEIERNVSNEIKNEVKEKEEYFVLQVNKKQGKNKKEIVKQIEEINRRTGLKCILLPIGYAQGHEDHIVLRKIYKEINDKNICFIPEFNNIFETIYILKNSKLYVGTSLHGAITAISYNIPHIALTSNIKKLIDFLTTWKTTPIIKTEINELANNIEKIVNDYENAKKIVLNKSREMIELVEENFNNINNIIEGIDNE